jgi:hypothetical protein
MSTENLSADSVIFLDGEVSPAILASVFGYNVSYLYQEAQKGSFPTNGSSFKDVTYRQALKFHNDYYRKAQELKAIKLQNDQALKEQKLRDDLELKKRKVAAFSAESGDDTMHPLMAMKLKQDVRLNRAREEQLLQKTAIERGEFISLEQQAELIEPMVIQLRGSLLSLADISEEHEKLVDTIMEDIYNLAVKLTESAIDDAKDYVQELMNREIEFDE